MRRWLEARVAAARADQVAAQRGGQGQEDDCDAAAAEEMVCALLLRGDAASSQPPLLAELKALLDRDEYVWRGVYDDRRFDQHARGYLRKLSRMAKANEGFGKVRRYQ